MGDSVALGSAYGSIEIGTDGATQSVNSLAASMRSAGAAMSAALTLPLVGIGVAAVNSAGDFEQSMNVLQSVSSATATDMAALQQQALALGADTSFSAGEAAEAMLELGKAGLDADAIMGAMPGVLSLAAAGNMNVATAAGIAANAVNTFGLEASETTNVANMLAAAANASSADVGQLAAGFQMSASVFASNGQSMSDLTTAMSLMANAGIAGSDAGTSLKTMLMRLAAPTDEAAAAMADLGLNVYNLDGSMRPFQDIVGDLGTATAGLSDAQRNAALSTIFGADAIRAATILTNSGAEGWTAMEAAVNKSGAAQEAANARMRGRTAG
jgi:TP901 family phage tail tape measure protein